MHTALTAQFARARSEELQRAAQDLDLPFGHPEGDYP
jgi:hypothetical protein